MQRCFTKSTRRLFLNKVLFLVISSFATTIFLMQLISTPANDTENMALEALEYAAKDSRYSEVFRKRSKLPNDIKYILLWTEYDYAPFYYFEKGQRSFIKNNCSAINCYITTNRNLFKGDITKFHAVAFNGRTMSVQSLPKRRSPNQKYIYVNMESSDNYPICNYKYDGFFNWTATYKLNSDIPLPYIAVKNKQAEIIGPQTNMRWHRKFPDIPDNLSARLKNKTKAAAWFVSHCASRSGRDQFVKNLQKVLKHYGLTVDVYGSCGPLNCSKYQQNNCHTLLEKDYFFYLSLENSFAEDYVTEKVLTALLHNTVPIVYGGATYSRFLPPNSYIDSKKFNVIQLAAFMHKLMHFPELYSYFFRWKSQYTYSDPSRKENICAVCAAMNNKEKIETVTVYNSFRKWWNPNYENRGRRRTRSEPPQPRPWHCQYAGDRQRKRAYGSETTVKFSVSTNGAHKQHIRADKNEPLDLIILNDGSASIPTYSKRSRKEDVCGVCTALNNNEKFKITTVYAQFRKWWNPNYETRCCFFLLIALSVAMICDIHRVVSFRPRKYAHRVS